MFKPKRLTFDELVERLRAFELKYGYSTIEFYRRFENGELGDDDDLMMWAGIYHLYLTSLPIRQLVQQEFAAASKDITSLNTAQLFQPFPEFNLIALPTAPL